VEDEVYTQGHWLGIVDGPGVADAGDIGEQERAKLLRPPSPFALEGGEVGIAQEDGEIEVRPGIRAALAAGAILGQANDARIPPPSGKEAPE
jgi:hypothetical protein